MSAHDDGGPAFPQVEIDTGGQRREWFGMTLRDYFAARAMESTLRDMLHRVGDVFGYEHERCVAQCAYSMADAMLAARSA